MPRMGDLFPRFLTLALYIFAPPSPNQDLCSPGTHPCPQGVSFRSSFRTANSYRGAARSLGRQGTVRARLPAQCLWASLPHGLGHHQRALACTHLPSSYAQAQGAQAQRTAASTGTVAQLRHDKAGGRGLFIKSHRMKQGLCGQVPPRYGFCQGSFLPEEAGSQMAGCLPTGHMSGSQAKGLRQPPPGLAAEPGHPEHQPLT